MSSDDDTDDRPSIELVPQHAQDEYEPPSDEEVLAWYSETDDYYDEAAHAAAEERISDYEGDEVDKAQTPGDDRSPYEKADDALLHAIQRSSWWEHTQYDGTNLDKAPGIWRHGNQVPEYVRAVLQKVVHNRSWDWQTFDEIGPNDTDDMKAILDEVITQPQGWTLRELTEAIQDHFGVEQGKATGMAADTSHSLLNVAREQAYRDMEGSEQFVYDWIGPSDHRTTPVCREIKQAIEDKGGAVTMSTLQSILMRTAQQYEGTAEGGGTPQLVDDWTPHFQCRHTFVRRVRSI